MIKGLWRIIPALLVIVLGAVILFGYNTLKGFFDKKEQLTITHHTTLKEIEGLGKIELVKYHFKDVVEFEKEDYSWLPSSKVVLIAGGEAVGCIDLQKITEQDIVHQNDTVYIHLPEPELCYFKINHEQSKVYDLKYTYFQDKNLIDAAYRAAEKQLREAALEMGILNKTKENSEIILKPILEKLTGKKVIFSNNLKSESIKPY